MDNGTVAIGAPSQNQGAPSSAGFIIGSPSPSDPSLTQVQSSGNSSLYSNSFTTFISGLAQSVKGAIVGIEKKAVYKGDVVLGTIQKQYYQAVSGAYGAVASGGQAVQNVAQKIETGSTLLVLAVIAFIAFPYIIALRKK